MQLMDYGLQPVTHFSDHHMILGSFLPWKETFLKVFNLYGMEYYVYPLHYTEPEKFLTINIHFDFFLP